MILQRINTRGGAVLLRFDCADSKPGQCVTVDGKYFVIAHNFNGVGSVVTRPGTSIDLPPGTHVDLSKPVGRGFDLTDHGVPVIVTGGLGFAAGLSLAQKFSDSCKEYRMVAYTRRPSQIDDVMGLLNLPKDNRIMIWNTELLGRPDTPLGPLDVDVTPETPFFFAGPKSLHEACRDALDKMGLTGTKIRVNY